ncbi:O-antigen ligase family protein [Erythrobacter sp. SDW2]|uniref:O-antigen ligase family protein n=1 Tax=Erythrobacter sp. SDW2 TaxID=2907154 RepID=UPI001F2884FF|nr:O-antigen ligase family protein [Erythrobacter sp. SDW2]UIP06369.1 O-antigen ligase family protein [Erythrobacter sp. SDW2]
MPRKDRTMDDNRRAQRPSAAPGALVRHLASMNRMDRLFVLALLLMAPVFGLVTMETVYAKAALRTFSVPILVAEVTMLVVAAKALASRNWAGFELSSTAKILGALWATSITISLLGAEFRPGEAQLRFTMTILHFCFGVIVWGYLTQNPGMRRDCLVAAAAGLGLLFVLAYCFGLWNSGNSEFRWTLFGVGVSNIRHYGYLSLVLTGIAGGLWLNAPDRTDEAWPALLFFLGVFMIMWTGGRGAFIALLVQLSVLLAIGPSGRRLAFAGRALAALAVATLLAAAWVPAQHFGPLNIFLRLDTGTLPGEEYTTGRAEMWRQTAAAIPEHPWFGYGEAQFRKAIPAARGFSNHPHNLILQLLLQWGVIGTGLLAAILARLAWKARSLLKSPTELTYPCVALITGLLAVSMVDGPFFYALPTVLFLLALAILLAEAGNGGTFRK